MQPKYEVSTREIGDQKYYIVKHFLSFPELKNVPDVLEHMGMDKDFYKACRLASVYDISIIESLHSQVSVVQVRQNKKYVTANTHEHTNWLTNILPVRLLHFLNLKT